MITTINEFKTQNIKWYHGTKTNFNTFKLDNNISNTTYNLNKLDNNLGIFFTNNLIMAKSFAGVIEFDPNTGKYIDTDNIGYVIEIKINLSKTWILQDHIKNIDEDDAGQTYFDIIEEYGGGLKFREHLESLGYDSVLVNDVTTNYYADDKGYTILIVFDPEKIQIINKNKIN